MSGYTVLPYIFDLELSGKCNTVCSFCPRHEMKRGEQFMSEENFEHFMVRMKEYLTAVNGRDCHMPAERARGRIGSGSESPIRIILCGMGESLMHPKCSEWVGRIRKELGLRVTVVTNGLMLKDNILEKLKEADITVVLVSVPGIDRESYSRVMKLDWDLIIKRIERANQVLPGRVNINATIPDGSTYTPQNVIDFWSRKGIPLGGISFCHNRGGFLTDDSLTGQFLAVPSKSFCGIYARHNFIAWDGHVLSCCHDLHAENKLGHLATDPFLHIAERKTPAVENGPTHRICANCNDAERCHAKQILVVAKQPTPSPIGTGPGSTPSPIGTGPGSTPSPDGR